MENSVVGFFIKKFIFYRSSPPVCEACAGAPHREQEDRGGGRYQLHAPGAHPHQDTQVYQLNTVQVPIPTRTLRYTSYR